MIGFMTLIDIRNKLFTPSKSLPWSHDEQDYKTKIVAYVFVALGLISILVSLVTYFNNQRKILQRMLHVGHGWAGYSMALMIMLFVVFIMAVSLTE